MKTLRVSLGSFTVLAALVAPCIVQAVDLRDDYGRLVNDGLADTEVQDYEAATTDFRDALLVKPEGAEAMMNLAIARARAEQHEDAIASFNRILDSAPDDADLAARALYNRGRSEFDLARSLYEGQDAEGAVRSALSSLDSFGKALEKDPALEDAEFNRDQVRHFLKKTVVEPPPPQQQQSGDDQQQEQGEEQNQGGESQDQSQSDEQEQGEQNNDRQQNQSGDQNEPDESEQPDQQPPESDEQPPEDGEEQEESESENQQQDAEHDEQQDAGGEQADGTPSEEEQQMGQAGMTPDQAEDLLRTLDKEKMLLLRPRLQTKQLEKTW